MTLGDPSFAQASLTPTPTYTQVKGLPAMARKEVHLYLPGLWFLSLDIMLRKV
jgi:hypothetical protein